MEFALNNQNLVERHDDPSSAKLGVLNLANITFDVRRIYWITDFQDQTIRGQHAHKNLTQLMLLLTGSMDLEIFEGEKSRLIRLIGGDQPVLITPGQWRVMKNASSDAVVLVLASKEYDESDYIRNWDEYLEWYRDKI